ncbi:MAG: hypothetical protein KU37_10690 [Sulfuricurvum sp. PC08-66]|nr:MAG: hypothetical protein KU37_10690 [Sulfuricurvum sp. PC08-66]
MTLKFYTLLTLLFIVVLGNFVYFFVTQESVELVLWGVHYPAYPVAVWVLVPFAFYYVIHILVMSVGSIQNYLRQKNYERDFERVQEAFYLAYLQKERDFEFKTPRYKLLGELIEKSTLTPKSGQTIEGNTKIDAVFQAFSALESGQVVELKRFGLPKGSPIVVKNLSNAMNKEPKKAEEILGNASLYNRSFLEEAFAKMATYASLPALLRYKNYVTLKAIENIVARVNKEDAKIAYQFAHLFELVKSLNVEGNGYVKLAGMLKTVCVPEERLHLFKTLSDAKEAAVEGMLYTYFDLVMIEQAKELLDNYGPNDYPLYRAYVVLKKHNHTCKLDNLLGR